MLRLMTLPWRAVHGWATCAGRLGGPRSAAGDRLDRDPAHAPLRRRSRWHVACCARPRNGLGPHRRQNMEWMRVRITWITAVALACASCGVGIGDGSDGTDPEIAATDVQPIAKGGGTRLSHHEKSDVIANAG